MSDNEIDEGYNKCIKEYKSRFEWDNEENLKFTPVCLMHLKRVFIRGLTPEVKSGVLVINGYMIQFSAPIVMRSFIYQNYGNETIAENNPTSLYEFIVKVFTAMCLESKELLQKSLGFGFEE
ncbi:3932_t:CDS:2 [Rhizophagus irregularis]|nr:3932_t:CDS:2 [Rhizophagus irregularis]